MENLRLATVSSRKFSSPPIKVYLTIVLNLRGRERRRRTSITGVATSLIESRAPPPSSLYPEPRYFCFNEHFGLMGQSSVFLMTNATIVARSRRCVCLRIFLYGTSGSGIAVQAPSSSSEADLENSPPTGALKWNFLMRFDKR